VTFFYFLGNKLVITENYKYSFCLMVEALDHVYV